ncbi:putative membrane protein [Amycolatopsis bartoniae]|uniref:Uncharacterized protein n=1 Tax=Amycolatopsis bartoniae TaxID=941986 RepID=A0A8H9IT01_9PSEU|nr:hypothetical protein [Amycolatopsis bartoniae]MBB2934435.1 putative membrane protein [Amycolatopsis bartoniae]TVT02171.1 hypothetical protein FNH07_27695 [Amycolatopsis bartoniae]GHF47379.1 hypothetical protein GCM10017566_20710 [Amycolatopsis bartoniae]
MAEPITAVYVQDDEDWTITVEGYGKKLTGRAPGIIAARDSVDQLVESLGPDAKGATVVHLLNGSALEFTATYMKARLARPEPAPLEVPASEAVSSEAAPAEVPAQQSEEQAKPQNKASRRPKAKLTADIGDALEKKAPAKAAAAHG